MTLPREPTVSQVLDQYYAKKTEKKFVFFLEKGKGNNNKKLINFYKIK